MGGPNKMFRLVVAEFSVGSMMNSGELLNARGG